MTAKGPFSIVCLFVILTWHHVGAAEIPAGTVLSVRQEGLVASRSSRAGAAVNAVLLSPVVVDGRTALPAGSELLGRVVTVQKIGLGIHRQTASLTIDFQSIRLARGKTIEIDALMKHVETAREWVDAKGSIHGIRPVTNVSSSLAVAAWRLLVIAPVVGASVWATKLVFAPAPDTEITFGPGTEYRLELLRPLRVEDADLPSAGLPARLLSQESRSEMMAAMDALPSHRATRLSGEPSDLLNLVIIGPGKEVERAFQAAGWSTSDPKAARSFVRTYFSIVRRLGYRKAPMSTLLLDGSRPRIELQKSLNTFAKRHHIRIWSMPDSARGETIWVGSATEDIGIKFSSRARKFTHVIESHVDAERTKVVDDLLYTGCVSEAGLIERDNLPPDMENGTGTRLKTDGRVAVLRIAECGQPRVMSGVGAVERKSFYRFLAASFRTEWMRSNFVSLAYSGVHLTSATRMALLGKPPRDDKGVTLTSQQVAWLAQ